jgi:N6-L-threonylcarbamoyladenine synthase
VHHPPLEFCTDNGAMIALAGALRLECSLAQSDCSSASDGDPQSSLKFTVRPRWDLELIDSAT